MSMVIDAYRFGGSPPPDPMDYTPAFWYDASDLSTLWQDSAGTTPVTTDGDPVGKWDDKSGNSRNWTQSTSGSRPTYRTSGGLHWIEFDGSSDWMTGSAGMLAFASCAMFVAYRSESGVGDFANIIGAPHDTTHVSPYYRWNAFVRTSGGFELGFHKNGAQVNRDVDAAAVGNDVLLTCGYTGMWRNDLADVWYEVVRVNRALNYALAVGTNALTYPNSAASALGANVVGSGDFFKGRIYGILGADATVASQAHIDNWEGWLESKY